MSTDRLDDDSEYHVFPRARPRETRTTTAREIAIAMNSGPRNFLVFRWQDIAGAAKRASRIAPNRRTP